MNARIDPSATARVQLRGDALTTLRASVAAHPGAEGACAVVASHVVGLGALPTTLGLGDVAYASFLAHYFPHHLPPLLSDEALERAEVRAELASPRGDEIEALEELFAEFAPDASPSDRAWHRIIAHACLGGDHLWSDLGLGARTELRALLTAIVPQLVAENTQDMRWKRFFYRQLCERGGDYICRSPSCETCSSYDECFVTPDEGSS